MLVMSFLQKVSFDILSAGDANREACTSLGLVLGILIANPILELMLWGIKHQKPRGKYKKEVIGQELWAEDTKTTFLK